MRAFHLLKTSARLLALVGLVAAAAQAQAQGAAVSPQRVHQDISQNVQARGLASVLVELTGNPYASYQYEVVALTPDCRYLVHTVTPDLTGRYCSQVRNPNGLTQWPNLIEEAQQAGSSQKRWVNWFHTWDTTCVNHSSAVICVARRQALPRANKVPPRLQNRL